MIKYNRTSVNVDSMEILTHEEVKWLDPAVVKRFPLTEILKPGRVYQWIWSFARLLVRILQYPHSTKCGPQQKL
jgi:hypothetical protein